MLLAVPALPAASHQPRTRTCTSHGCPSNAALGVEGAVQGVAPPASPTRRPSDLPVTLTSARSKPVTAPLNANVIVSVWPAATLAALPLTTTVGANVFSVIDKVLLAVPALPAASVQPPASTWICAVCALTPAVGAIGSASW